MARGTYGWATLKSARAATKLDNDDGLQVGVQTRTSGDEAGWIYITARTQARSAAMLPPVR